MVSAVQEYAPNFNRDQNFRRHSMADLTGKQIAVLMANGFEDSEFNEPVTALREQGAEAVVVSTKSEPLRGKHGTEVTVNYRTAEVDSSKFDALLLPGGVVN